MSETASPNAFSVGDEVYYVRKRKGYPNEPPKVCAVATIIEVENRGKGVTLRKDNGTLIFTSFNKLRRI